MRTPILSSHFKPVRVAAAAPRRHKFGEPAQHRIVRRSAAGYALIMVLLVVIGVSLATTVAVRQQTLEQQREREMDLLFAGQQFRNALASYAAVSRSNSSNPRPRTLDELLLDNRSPVPLRHLRRIYVDPMTGKADWILEMVQGRIVGVHSSSGKAPLQRTGFPDGMATFSDAQSYRDWRFMAEGYATNAATTQVSAQAAANPSAAPGESSSAPASGNPTAAPAAVDPFAATVAQCSAPYSADVQACYTDRTPGTDPSKCAAGFRNLIRDCIAAANTH